MATKKQSPAATRATLEERRRETRQQRVRVLITGAGSSLGRVLCRRLHRTFDVLGLDVRPFPDRP